MRRHPLTCPSAGPALPARFPSPYPKPSCRTMSKKSLLIIIAFLVALIAAMALNPSDAKHRSAIRDAVAQRSPIAGALGIGSLKAMTVEYHSFGVVSYTSSDDHVISVGALGMVHVRQDAPPEK